MSAGERGGQLARTVAVALTWTGNLPFWPASDATFHLWTLATAPAEVVLVGELSNRHFADQDQFRHRAWPAVPLIAVLTGVVLLAWRDWTEVGHPALRQLVWLGTASYAAYLWNYPLTVWLRPHLGVAAGVTAAAATLVLAAVSWRLVEQPTRSTPKVLVA